MQSIAIIGASHLLEVEFDLVSCVDMFSIIIPLFKELLRRTKKFGIFDVFDTYIEELHVFHNVDFFFMI